MAVSETVLRRAGDNLRDLLAENVVSPDAASIIEGMLAAIGPDNAWLVDPASAKPPTELAV